MLNDALYTVAKKERHTVTIEKFMKGLCFESAGVALKNKGFITTQEVIQLCSLLAVQIKNNPENLEDLGYQVFKTSQLSAHPGVRENYEKLFGSGWKKTRFRNLVRIGADVLNTPLATEQNPVLTGALWQYRQATSR